MFAKDILKEKIIKITQAKKLMEKLKVPENDSGDYEYIYVVFDRDEKYLIKAIWGDSEEELEKWRGFIKCFEEYAEQENPQKIGDYMFFLDVYDRSRIHEFPLNDIYGKHFTKDPILDQMLCESKGFLLWRYQLEILLGVFMHDNTQPRILSKILDGSSLSGEDFFPEKQEFLSSTKEMKFSDNLSLYDVLHQRTVGGMDLRLRVPTWKYGCNFYRALEGLRK